MSTSATSVGSRSNALPAALTKLLVHLHELAGVSDAIVDLVESKPEMDLVKGLVRRSAELHANVAQASHAARGFPMPPGRDGAALVALVKDYNTRIQAGTQAKEMVLSYWKTVDAFAGQFVAHAIENLASIAAWPSVAALRDAFRGQPAVLVSAGPSLDKNIEVIRRFKGKALIVAASHALLALHRAGIDPDMVVVIEAQDVRYHFEGVPVDRIGSLVLAAAVRPELFALPVERFITFAANPMIDTWVYEGLEEHLPIRAGGSVSTVAFSVATILGCDPIIVVGQDLSFPDGRYYAATTCDGDARVALTTDGTGRVVEASEAYRKLEPEGPENIFLREVPGYHGGSVPTSFALRRAWAWFVDEAKRQTGERTLLNCTEGGAYIEGMEHVPLEQAAVRYARDAVAVDACVDRAVGAIDREGRRTRMSERVTDMGARIDRTVDQARQCRALAERAKRRPAQLAPLQAAERDLTRSLESMPFLSTMVQPEVRDAMAAGKKATSVREGLDASIRLYDAVARTAVALRAPIERALESLRQPIVAVPRPT